MKIKLFTILAILAIGLAGFAQPAQAQAYDTSFTTSITFQNVGTADTTTLQILFYVSPTDVAPIVITRPNLAAGAGTSVSIGGLTDIDPGFKGSAVMQADQPLLATLVQVPAPGGLVKNRPLSNGFSAGAPQSLIATVLKNQFSPANNTVFSVQNVDSVVNDINIKFYDTTAAMVLNVDYADVAPGAAIYYDTGAAGDALPTPSFNGSAVITAARNDATPGAIVSSAMELEVPVGAVGAKAFEGVAEGATTFYMPSALCNFDIGGGNLTNTSFAVQNTSLTTATDVTVTYSNAAFMTKTIGAGAKASFVACQATNSVQNWKGSATITSSATPVIAVGKAYGAGLSTAFVGAAAGSGSEKVALPYVRYASAANWASGAQQRVFITIQNIGAAAITDNIVVQYISCTGAILATHTISTDVAPGDKVNTNASAAGLTEFGTCGAPGGPAFGGGAMITGPAGSELAAVARVQTLDTVLGLTVGEDYNGLNP
jgi:hypothetical protein